MKTFEIKQNGIEILDKSSFNPKHILECGQVFCYDEMGDDYVVFPQDKFAKIVATKNGYFIQTTTPKFFVDYFDLERDYDEIKHRLQKFKILQQPLKFGYGIRILKQNLFEMLISFVVSQNNNIKRIQLILNRLRQKFGSKTQNGYAFPTQKQLLTASVQDFSGVGAGYRASYLYKILRQVDDDVLQKWSTLPTPQLRKNLIALSGVGPKVADCILLFGYGRGDVFPVDTWINQMYNTYYTPLDNREKIRQNLVAEFGDLSGFAQQYLFYFQRSGQNA